MLEAYAAPDEDAGEQVLTHGDIGMHNLAVDPATGRLVGLFDFDLAAWDDRHVDLYSLHSYGDDFVELTLDAYMTVAGRRPSARRAGLHHLLGAFEALAGALAEGDPYWIARRRRWVDGAIAGAPGRLLGLPAMERHASRSRPAGA